MAFEVCRIIIENVMDIVKNFALTRFRTDDPTINASLAVITRETVGQTGRSLTDFVRKRIDGRDSILLPIFTLDYHELYLLYYFDVLRCQRKPQKRKFFQLTETKNINNGASNGNNNAYVYTDMDQNFLSTQVFESILKCYKKIVVENLALNRIYEISNVNHWMTLVIDSNTGKPYTHNENEDSIKPNSKTEQLCDIKVNRIGDMIRQMLVSNQLVTISCLSIIGLVMEWLIANYQTSMDKFLTADDNQTSTDINGVWQNVPEMKDVTSLHDFFNSARCPSTTQIPMSELKPRFSSAKQAAESFWKRYNVGFYFSTLPIPLRIAKFNHRYVVLSALLVWRKETDYMRLHLHCENWDCLKQFMTEFSIETVQRMERLWQEVSDSAGAPQKEHNPAAAALATTDIHQYLKPSGVQYCQPLYERLKTLPTWMFKLFRFSILNTNRDPHTHYKFVHGKIDSSDSIDRNWTFAQMAFENKSHLMQFISQFTDDMNSLDPFGLRKIGILLSGLPGCGKTKFVTALCNFLGRPVVSFDFSQLHTRSEFEQLYNFAMKNNAIMVWDEFDHLIELIREKPVLALSTHTSSAEASEPMKKRQKTQLEIIGVTDNDQVDGADMELKMLRSKVKELKDLDAAAYEEVKNEYVSKLKSKKIQEKTPMDMAYLLTLLDGVSSTDGRVIVATTNYPERIEKALRRPGRFDFEMRFTYMTNAAIHDLLKIIYHLSDPEDEYKTYNEIQNTSSDQHKSLLDQLTLRNQWRAERRTWLETHTFPENTWIPAQVVKVHHMFRNLEKVVEYLEHPKDKDLFL